jgi:hypothetical protein
VVQRLLKHVNAINPARGKRDKQVPLPPFNVEYPNLEVDRAVSGYRQPVPGADRQCRDGSLDRESALSMSFIIVRSKLKRRSET